MEADWEVEIGPDAPVIDVYWTGLVDLRQSPEFARHLPEAVRLPALVDVLQLLNAPNSPVWTSKCDVWDALDESELDPYELDATPESAVHAVACYIDLLPGSSYPWIELATALDFCTALCSRLRDVDSACSRVDLVIRQATFSASNAGLGITAYVTACGPTTEAANQTMQRAVGKFANAVCTASTLK